MLIINLYVAPHNPNVSIQRGQVTPVHCCSCSIVSQSFIHDSFEEHGKRWEEIFFICMITLWLTCNFLSSISRQWHHDAVIAHHVMLCISCICHNVGQDICLVSYMKMGPYWVSSGWSIAGAWPEWATGMVSKFVCHPFALALCFNCWTKVAIPLDPTLYSQIFDYHTFLEVERGITENLPGYWSKRYHLMRPCSCASCTAASNISLFANWQIMLAGIMLVDLE